VNCGNFTKTIDSEQEWLYTGAQHVIFSHKFDQREEAPMLVEFCVGNYRSFLDRATLSMVATNLRSQDKELDANNVFDATARLRLLRSAAIYGANASGKSNLVQALQFMRSFVMRSTEGTDPFGGIPVERFRLAAETEDKPSFFQVVFLRSDGTRYRYGFEVTGRRVETEWLYSTPKSIETMLFERRGDEFDFGPRFREGKDFVEKVRPNALLLSTAGQWNNALAAQVIDWFRRDLWVGSALTDRAMQDLTLARLERPETREAIVELVRAFDLGITDFVLQPAAQDALPVNSGPSDASALKRALAVIENWQARLEGQAARVQVKTLHKVFSANGDLAGIEEFDLHRDESEGTKKLFAMAGPLLAALEEGRAFVVDELDARLHPLITRAIIALFNSPESNPRDAQLVFATHDTNLLDRRYFRRDQIWFTEKDRRGSTQLYSLAEFRVRNDASYGRDYIRGKYGGVPYVGDLERFADEGVINAQLEEAAG
jgi:hypothetical protein